MKPETQKKMDLIVPLIAHLLEGGALEWKFGVKTAPQRRQDIGSLESIINAPENWTIIREPRAIYVHECGGELHCYHVSEPKPEPKQRDRIVRFIEDMDWKQESK